MSGRFERILLALALGLPVPVIAATGLAVPLPAIVERVAAALVPFGDAPALAVDTVLASARNGSIVAAPGEEPYTVQESANEPEAAVPEAPRRTEAPEPRESYAVAAAPSAPTGTSIPDEAPQDDVQPPATPEQEPSNPGDEPEPDTTAPADEPGPPDNLPEPPPPAPSPTPSPKPKDEPKPADDPKPTDPGTEPTTDPEPVPTLPDVLPGDPAPPKLDPLPPIEVPEEEADKDNGRPAGVGPRVEVGEPARDNVPNALDARRVEGA